MSNSCSNCSTATESFLTGNFKVSQSEEDFMSSAPRLVLPKAEETPQPIQKNFEYYVLKNASQKTAFSNKTKEKSTEELPHREARAFVKKEGTPDFSLSREVKRFVPEFKDYAKKTQQSTQPEKQTLFKVQNNDQDQKKLAAREEAPLVKKNNDNPNQTQVLSAQNKNLSGGNLFLSKVTESKQFNQTNVHTPKNKQLNSLDDFKSTGVVRNTYSFGQKLIISTQNFFRLFGEKNVAFIQQKISFLFQAAQSLFIKTNKTVQSFALLAQKIFLHPVKSLQKTVTQMIKQNVISEKALLLVEKIQVSAKNILNVLKKTWGTLNQILPAFVGVVDDFIIRLKKQKDRLSQWFKKILVLRKTAAAKLPQKQDEAARENQFLKWLRDLYSKKKQSLLKKAPS